MAELYKLTFPNGKGYIGVTSFTAEKRFREHCKRRTVRRRTALHCALAHFRPDAVEIDVLDRAEIIEDLFVRERTAIVEHGTRWPAGYNLTDGGDGVPMIVPAEARHRAGLKQRGRPKHSPEARERIRAAARNRTYSVATRAKMSAAKKGKPPWNKGLKRGDG